MPRSTLALTALAFALVPTMALAQRGGVTIEGAGQAGGEHDCAGGPARIEGAGNEVTFTGVCSSLTIEGASNIVRVNLAPGAAIRIEGAGNIVRWSMPGNARPRQSVQGAGNALSRVR
jgi:hypothetical protein